MPADDLLFLHSRHDPDCRARVDKYFDGYYTLQFMDAGGGAVDVWYDDTFYRMGSEDRGWFWPAYPGPRIRFHLAPGHSFWQHRYAAFQGPRVARWISEGIWPMAPQSVPPMSDYPARFDTLLSLLREARDPWRTARAINLLEAFLLEIAEARAGETAGAGTLPPEPWLADLLTALEADGDQTDLPTDYAALARRFGTAPSTLRRHFKAAVGIPLHEYALQQRTARARTLLGETDLPIKLVAERLGYSDVYFFTRQFRQRTGVTPAAYRRSRQT